jgi:hypothetical protein
VRTTRTQTPQGGSDDDDDDAATPTMPGDSTPSRAPQHSDIFVASFGVTGEVYHSTANSLGIDDDALKPLLAAIHLHVVRETCNILSTRGKLDALLQQQPQQQPASARRGEG